MKGKGVYSPYRTAREKQMDAIEYASIIRDKFEKIEKETPMFRRKLTNGTIVSAKSEKRLNELVELIENR